MRIKPSGSGFGDGLFTADTATGRVPTNTRIGLYTGAPMTRLLLNELYPDNSAQYAVYQGGRPRDEHRCVDARRTNASAVRYANSSRGIANTNDNAKISYDPRTRTFSLKSKRRPIGRDREIFTSYSRGYNLNS